MKPEELKIEVPSIFMHTPGAIGKSYTIPFDEVEKWKSQCEKLNALLDKAHIVDGFCYNDGKGKPEPGIFIPLPEEDTAIKFVKDLIEDYESKVPNSMVITPLAYKRACRLLKKEGKV